MRVYLDNNVLIDIEEHNYCLEDFLLISGVEYYYSNAHIGELLNGVDKSISKLKERRLSTINAVCGDKYLFQDNPFVIRYARCKPEHVYKNLSQIDFIRRDINELASSFTPNRVGIMKELQWDVKKVGNFSPEDIFDAIDKEYRSSGSHCGIKEYLLLSEAYTEKMIYSSLFNLLDMVGYRKDKNNVARLYDASHAYYAQKCDVLVSNDARMRVKAEAVYHYRNAHTRVMNADEFLEMNIKQKC